MPNLILSIFLQAYEDLHSSNAPSLSNFRWDRNLNSIPANNPLSNAFVLAPGESKTLFSGVRTLLQDITTQYSLAVVPLSSNTYILNWVGGTTPNFRTPRTPGSDATTQVTSTQNGPLLTFSSTGGTPFALLAGGVQVGDFVTLGNLFNVANQGQWQVVAAGATSFTVSNELGVAEGPITLGSGYSSQVQLYSAAGVQINDTLNITGGFSPVTQGPYKVTAVTANSLQFYSTDALPQEGPITTQAIAVYSAAKKFAYLESDQNCTVLINGSNSSQISPIVISNSTQPGVFMNSSTIYSLSVTNNSPNTANLFLASVE